MLKETILKPFRILPQPKFTRQRNAKLYDWINESLLGKRVLNLGSGIGNFDHMLSSDIQTISLDIDPTKPGLDVLADAHGLPFKNETFEGVYSIAVLEHVKKPWLVAEEITRVLRPGGYVALELPFLNVIHDAHDYFRFTDKGIRSLFDETEYDVVLEQVGSGGGSFFSVFLYTYFEQFIPTKPLKFLWRAFAGYVFSLCKYLDLLINRSETLRVTANSFTFIGIKR
jgi:ubiquinone/menaquinone biosynthesis C-methylase UbiE